MPAPLQIKRSGTAGPRDVPNLLVGELAWSSGGFNAYPPHTPGSNSVVIGLGGAAHEVLIGPTRQLEIAGNQAVVGIKTFPLASISIQGGTAGQILSTNGAGVHTWIPPATGGIGAVATDGDTIEGDGSGPDPVRLNISAFTSQDSGLEYPATGRMVVTVATQAAFGGTYISSDAAIIDAAPTDASAVSPRGLRTQLGAAAATLTTTAKVVVPAINELHAIIQSVSNVLRLVGTFNATNANVTPGPGGELNAGPLPAASTANTGFYLIVTVAGTPPGPNAPNVAMLVGDWIVSDGADWVHIDLAQPAIAAGSVSVNPTIGGATDVQAALQYLDTKPVLVTGPELVGDGQSGNEITLVGVDGGTY